MQNFYCKLTDLAVIKKYQQSLLKGLKRNYETNRERFIRGKEIVENKLIKELIIDKGLIIAKVKDYDVRIDFKTKQATCTCQDFQKRKKSCKHILAVALKSENLLSNLAYELELKQKREERKKTENPVEALFYDMISDLASYVEEDKTDGYFSLAQRYMIKLKKLLQTEQNQDQKQA